jgi:CheY-like chemotaxis protein
MDLQMPEMDGYQATAKIRSDARFAQLPIIAMTAHATMEERQRCLAAGMNDHLSKPIDPALLFDTVGKFYQPAPLAPSATRAEGQDMNTPHPPSGNPLPVGRGEGRGEGAVSPGDDLPPIDGLDTKDGLSRVARNRKLYLKLLRQFVEQQGPALSQISAALAQGDVALAERVAHTLKGVAGNIGAKSVQVAAGIVEKLIRDRAEAAAVESAIQRVAIALDPLLAQLQPALESAAAAAPAQVAAPTLPADPAQSRAFAEQLIRLLSEFDPGAADFIEANRSTLSPLFPGDAWTAFEKLVQNYAFAEAQASLEQALLRQ